MIVPMNKIAVIVRSADAGSCVEKLRRRGVLHVEHQLKPQGRDIAVLQEDLALASAALDVYAKNNGIKARAAFQDKINTDWRITARHLIDLENRHEQLYIYSQKLKAAIAEWEKWQDFEPQKLAELAAKGIFVSLYQVPRKKLNSFFGEAIVKTIYTEDGFAYCAAVSRKKPAVNFKEIPPPKHSLSYMQKRLSEDNRTMHELKDEIYKLFSFYEYFSKIKSGLEKELELQQAINGMAQSGSLTYIMGYAPVDKVQLLLEDARSNKWGLLAREPAEEDNVPVLLRNPRWIEVIKPVFRFLEILPGYRELDISLLFLAFFSIFFGILIGDAGYGIVYFAITFWLHKKARRKKQAASGFYLYYILSSCAIIWGVLTGTFFGHEWFINAGFKPLLPALNDEKGLQRFCFFLGALHLTIAHSWRAILKAPSPGALGDVGWICILWSANFIARTLILGDILPSFCAWLALSGAALIIIFTSPRKNILKSAEEWIAWLVTLPFSFIGNFADVVSYIRLFAVGMAGVAIADAFNAMAAMVGKSNMLMIALAAFIALIGNVLGIILGPVSVLVHGVRLNLLEFSGHAGISWSGRGYKPLKE